jgi:hypothetical protein
MAHRVISRLPARPKKKLPERKSPLPEVTSKERA